MSVISHKQIGQKSREIILASSSTSCTNVGLSSGLQQQQQPGQYHQYNIRSQFNQSINQSFIYLLKIKSKWQ